MSAATKSAHADTAVGALRRVAVLGASGKTGVQLVEEALSRGMEVSAVCRAGSEGRLAAYRDAPGFALHVGPQVSDPDTLRRALAGCDGAVAILLSVRGLRATEVVRGMQACAAADGPRRVAFTCGEVTFVPEADERYTPRQKVMSALARVIGALSPYSVADMLRASRAVRAHDWDWTAVRAPTLVDGPAAGYARCALSDIQGRHELPRRDYAAALLDALADPLAARRAVAVRPT